MSMVGIRDMSLLETPPEERLPVKTYVMDYDDGIIREAIRRELQRDGQVYFLYNRVRSIEQMRQRIQALVPEARIGPTTCCCAPPSWKAGWTCPRPTR